MLIPTGMTVQFFDDADRNNEPVAAIVTQSNPQGILTLATFPPGAAEAMYHRSVRHIDDEWLKDRPEAARATGGWDFVPPVTVWSDEPNANEFKRRPGFSVKDRIEVVVMKLFEKEIPINEIAGKVNISADQIERIIAKHTQLPEPATA